jgi:hypothetical protein
MAEPFPPDHDRKISHGLSRHDHAIPLNRCLLHGETAAGGRVQREDVQAVAAWDWGSMPAARQ